MLIKCIHTIISPPCACAAAVLRPRVRPPRRHPHHHHPYQVHPHRRHPHHHHPHQVHPHHHPHQVHPHHHQRQVYPLRHPFGMSRCLGTCRSKCYHPLQGRSKNQVRNNRYRFRRTPPSSSSDRWSLRYHPPHHCLGICRCLGTYRCKCYHPLPGRSTNQIRNNRYRFRRTHRHCHRHRHRQRHSLSSSLS